MRASLFYRDPLCTHVHRRETPVVGSGTEFPTHLESVLRCLHDQCPRHSTSNLNCFVDLTLPYLRSFMYRCLSLRGHAYIRDGSRNRRGLYTYVSLRGFLGHFRCQSSAFLDSSLRSPLCNSIRRSVHLRDDITFYLWESLSIVLVPEMFQRKCH